MRPYCRSHHLAQFQLSRVGKFCKTILLTKQDITTWTIIQSCKTGIHISAINSWLAASPDGIVQDPSQIEGKRTGILEIKCPYSGRTMTPEAAYQEINRFYSTLNNGQVTLKKKHNYHYQVQGQLAITELPWCDFIIWTPQGMSVQRIECDENFWKLMYP